MEIKLDYNLVYEEEKRNGWKHYKLIFEYNSQTNEINSTKSSAEILYTSG
jgi:hypothetical protein